VSEQLDFKGAALERLHFPTFSSTPKTPLRGQSSLAILSVAQVKFADGEVIYSDEIVGETGSEAEAM
jgi:hypothetical protein